MRPKTDERRAMVDHAKHAADAVSVGTALATLAGWLPHMAAAASLIWTLIRIYETKTVQGWLRSTKEEI
jgi:hypothetical protein